MGARRLSGWLIAAAISAYACHLAVQHPTPIDRALPFIGAVIALAGAPVAVPLLIACEIVIVSETLRLIAFGIVIAAGMVWAAKNGRVYTIAVASLLLLRWIPFENVHVGREIVLLLCALAIVWLLRATPFAVLVAVVVCLVTPAIPLRTLALPLAVISALAVIRFFHMPRIALAVLSLLVLAWVLTFFAWSGVMARAFPYFTRIARDEPRRHVVNAALGPSRSVDIDVPHEATALIVSGANVAHLRRGTLLGRIEPGVPCHPERSEGSGRVGYDSAPLPPVSLASLGMTCRPIPIRVGDGSDWGYMRRDFFYGGHNPLPRVSAGKLRGYGYVAWVDGAGLVELPEAKTIRVVADASLPANAALQVEGFALR